MVTIPETYLVRDSPVAALAFNVFGLDKPLGLTSLQALDALRASDASLRGERLAHGGRLDPMAEGLLTVLVGDETRHVATVRNETKRYDLDVVFGIATDSFDSLGLVTALTPEPQPLDAPALAHLCGTLRGEIAQRYPPYSQARVNGRSLLAWGPAGVTMERPIAMRTVTANDLLGLRTVSLATLAHEAERRTTLVRGDFRQNAIAARWRACATEHPGAVLQVASLHVACSAGTYMRSLAYDLGAALGIPSLAWRIRRVSAGSLHLADARKLR